MTTIEYVLYSSQECVTQMLPRLLPSFLAKISNVTLLPRFFGFPYSSHTECYYTPSITITLTLYSNK